MSSPWGLFQLSAAAYRSFLYSRKSYAEKRSRQWYKLREVASSAYSRTWYYRRCFMDAGFDPAFMSTPDDLTRIPILTREDLRSNFPEGITDRSYRPGRNCLLVSTSGSTGQSVKLYRSTRSILAIVSLAGGFLRRFSGIAGFRFMTILCHSRGTIEAAFAETLPAFFRRSYLGIDAFANPAAHAEIIERFQPDVILTYPSVLAQLFHTRQGRGPLSHAPRLIYTTGEKLGESLRPKVDELFPKSRLLDSYFCTEAGMIAAECPEGGRLHVFTDNVLVEITRDGKPVPMGERGHILVTDLNNLATPLIRYNGLGDTAILIEGTCICGIEGHSLAFLAGRRVDCLMTPSGRIILPFKVTEALEGIQGLGPYQVVQERDDFLRVSVVSLNCKAVNDVVSGEIISRLQAVVGEHISCEAAFVEDIPCDPATGASYLIKSEVDGLGYS